MDWTNSYAAGDAVLVRSGTWRPAVVTSVMNDLVAVDLSDTGATLLIDDPTDMKHAAGAAVTLRSDDPEGTGHSWPATFEGLSDDGRVRLSLVGLDDQLVLVPAGLVHHERED